MRTESTALSVKFGFQNFARFSPQVVSRQVTNHSDRFSKKKIYVAFH